MIKKLVLGMVAGAVAFLLAIAISPNLVAAPTAQKTVSSPQLETVPQSTTIKAHTKTIEQLNVPADRAVFIVGPIMDMNDTVAQIYALDRKDPKSPIYLIIDSPGGSVMEGGKVISAIEGVTAPVNTVCAELCASMAAYVHSYGATRYITGNSMLMYHDYSGQFMGEGAHMHSLMSAIERFVKRLNAHVAERSGISLEKLEIGELKQIWIDSEDATEQGFNDKIASLDIAALLPKEATANQRLKQALKSANSQYEELKGLKDIL